MIATRGGVPIRVSDVAEVAIGYELRSGAATENGREIVLGTVLMLTGENPRIVAQAAADRLEQITASLPEGISAHPTYARTAQNGRAHVITPGNNAQLVCRLMLEKKKNK